MTEAPFPAPMAGWTSFPLLDLCYTSYAICESLVRSLRVIDVILLSQVCTLCRGLFRSFVFRAFSRRFAARLEWLGWRADVEQKWIVEQLQKGNGLISGSFILQLLLDEHYEGADIDFFYPYDLHETPAIPIDSDRIYYFPPAINESIDAGQSWYEGDRVISYQYEMAFAACPSLRTHKILVDGLTRANQREHVLGRFDFDFCRNAFDGCRLCVLSPDALRTRHSDVNRRHFEGNRLTAELERIQRYQRRGFSLSLLGEPIQLPVTVQYQLKR